MQRRKRSSALLTAALLLSTAGCFPGGIVDRGGFVDGAGILPEATSVRNASYRIVCRDRDEVKRREELVAKGEPVPNTPPVTYVTPEEYKGGCEVNGESSRFFLFHLWPVTPTPDPAYAMGLPVQELEGDTMINIRTWHETHYYSILGHVRVFRVRGDVIRFEEAKK